MNQITIQGHIIQIQDYNSLIYKLKEVESELFWIIHSCKELKLGWSVQVLGSVDMNVNYQDRLDMLVETTRNLIVIPNRVEILDTSSEIEESNEIVW